MNKAQLINALAERLGDRKVAAAAVAGLVDVVVRTVNAGDKVTITGFGVFEKRARAARTARNPRTGQAVTVQQVDVPAFRPGTLFREVVSGIRTLPADGVRSRARPAPSPAPRVTAASGLTAIQVAPAKARKTAKAAKPTEAMQSTEPPESAKVATKKARQDGAKAVTKAPTKTTGKKAEKKSASKKSAGKK